MVVVALGAALVFGCAVPPTKTTSNHTNQSVATASPEPAQTDTTDDTTTTAATEESVDWLTYLNTYRATAGLPAVSEDVALSAANEVHARYIVETGLIAHDEDPASPFFSDVGNEAGRASNVSGGTARFSISRVIDGWMAAPLHAVGILDPRLQTVGFGEYFDPSSSGLHYGAALDVIHGRVSSEQAQPTYPVMWPGHQQIVQLHKGITELPDPLTACDGYEAPTGLPIVLQIGNGSHHSNLLNTYIESNGVAVEHCVFDESTYVNPHGPSQDVVRSVLATRNAIVLIPRDPLTPGSTYTVSVQVPSESYDWTFAVSSDVRD
jgi:uncharacterized protein YkwD